MRKVYLSIKSLLSAGVVTLVGWLGLAGCGRLAINNGMCMYGTPTVDYQFKVKVVDQKGEPVEGLEVGIVEDQDRKLTSSSGEATIKGDYTGTYKDHEVHFVVKDIDGGKNGVVTDLNQAEKITKADFVKKGDGAWQSGSVEKTVNLKVEREEMI